MLLTQGTKLGAYEVLSPLGAGGMGEVYRARDTKLGRDVALKVLPAAMAHDPERMARFQREAQVLASLNHPNIAAIYGMEDSADLRALVMELVEGATLAERICPTPAFSSGGAGLKAAATTGAQRGALQPDECLQVAKQIADALEYAHERGVVHRDLKPANVKITSEGVVKILDFGLAKALAGERVAGDVSSSPTLSGQATQAGIILGTAGYMSPEQAKGKAVDRRADIWAFGCVLYEMLSGRKAFGGETTTDVLAAVVIKEPEWATLPPDTPPAIRNLLRRCLQKDAKQRLRDIGDARITIEEALAGGTDVPPVTVHGQDARATGSQRPPLQPWRHALPWAAVWALSMALIGGLVGSWQARRSAAPPQVLRLVINDTSGLTTLPAISPDGRVVAYARQPSSGGPARGTLLVRALDQFSETLIPGTQEAGHAFFSPDGSWIGYASPQGLMKVPAGGGTPQLICAANSGAEAVWGPGDTIVFYGGVKDGSLWPGLMRVSAQGGTPEVLTTVDASGGEFRDAWPTTLPDGDTVLFTANTKEGTRIEAVSLRTRQRRIVRAGGAFARYDPAGYLLYWASPSHNLLAAPFDAKRLEFTGAPVTVIEGVEITPTRSMFFDLSRNGTLIYVPDTTGSLEDKVVWVDRKGESTPVMDTVAEWVQPRLSPDGERLLLRKVQTNCDLWVYDLRRRVLTRLTFENDNHDPLWMPDGKHVVFDVPNGSVRGLMWQAGDGSGKAQALIPGVQDFIPSSWSGDGRFLALTLFGQSASQIWVVAKDGPPEPRLFHQNSFNEAWPSFSPDGRYLAYSSDESGRSEIYISPFPGPGAVTQVSAEGGINPLWSRDGGELFYENGPKMMVVKVATQPRLSVGVAQELFQGDFGGHFGSGFRRSFFGREYDVAPDGKRFVMVQPVGQAASLPDIHVIVDFSEELKRLVSAGAK